MKEAAKTHVSVEEALRSIPTPDGKRFATLFTHGTLLVDVYAPRGRDPQQPHSRDEVYIVLQGRGTFMIAGRREPFGPGDFLFAPAGVAHHFEDFTDDFATWVLFYGPEGGEKEA